MLVTMLVESIDRAEAPLAGLLSEVLEWLLDSFRYGGLFARTGWLTELLENIVYAANF